VIAPLERKYDLYSDAFRADTYATFAAMREHDPILLQPGIDGASPIWFVTRYEDAVAILLDDERFVRDPALAFTPEELASFNAGMPASFAFTDTHMLNKDGADHRRLRRLVTKAFTPRMVEQLRPRIQEIADDLIEALGERGEMELVDEFAFPLPITVIVELLGIPARDRDRFREWSAAVVTPALDPAAFEEFTEHLDAFVAYLRELFEARRGNPGPDLVSALLQAEEGGDTLSEQELFSMVVLLIVAGHETTVSLIGNAVLALLRHPEQLAALAADPTLVPNAVEALVRHDGPVERSLNRWAATDVELGGHTIRRGETVIVILGSANRDPGRFLDPDRFEGDGGGRWPASRLRPRQSLLPRRAARTARRRDRAHDAGAPPPWTTPRDARRGPALATRPALPQPRAAAGRLGRLGSGLAQLTAALGLRIDLGAEQESHGGDPEPRQHDDHR
jgi:cytochrome P450